MRVADRLFAFRRLPAWRDPVQVALWLVGWVGVGSVLLLLVVQYGPVASLFAAGGSPGEYGFLVVVALLFSFVVVVGWALAGCWFVSEAYRGWRAGQPRGRQWTITVGLLLLLSAALFFRNAGDDAWAALVLGLLVVAGLALLVAVASTRLPAPPEADPGPPGPPT